MKKIEENRNEEKNHHWKGKRQQQKKQTEKLKIFPKKLNVLKSKFACRQLLLKPSTLTCYIIITLVQLALTLK